MGRSTTVPKWENSSNTHIRSCLVCYSIWLIPTFFILGVSLFFSPNARIQDILGYSLKMVSICRYNEKALEWMQEGIQEMQRANLQLFVYGIEFQLVSDQSRPGKYFPIRDNCSKSDDPPDGCIYVSSYSLTTNVTLTKDFYIPLVVFDGSAVVMNTTLRRTKFLKSIQSVCIRVRLNETQFILDSPSEWSIYGDTVGCEASNRWKSVTYGKEVMNTIPIHVIMH